MSLWPYFKATLKFMGPLAGWRSALHECNSLGFFMPAEHYSYSIHTNLCKKDIKPSDNSVQNKKKTLNINIQVQLCSNVGKNV